MSTDPAGSTFVVGVGRGRRSAFALPTDNRGGAPYAQLGDVHAYTRWPDSGAALYAATGVAGGDGYVIRTSTEPSDEVTLAAVEVIEGARVQAAEWNEVLEGAPLQSRSVTTTGPATLVAFWWGDGFPMTDQTAVPDGGFTVVSSVLEGGSLVQCAVAVKNVAEPGTYDVTWTATPRQGAQLWLVAIQ
jgi:hypothetical protein